MTAKDNIEEKLNNLSNAIGFDDKLVENVMSRINNESDFGKSQAKTQNIWRIIKKSPLTKLATAAVIIIAVMFGLFNVEFNSRVYGITDVPEIIRQAETIHIISWGVTVSTSDDEAILGVGMLCSNYWIDLKNGRYNMEFFSSMRNPETDDVNDSRTKNGGNINVFDGQYIMQLNQTAKNTEFEKLTEFQRILSVRQTTDRFLEEIYMRSDELDDFVKSGTEQIAGEDYDIWENIQDVPLPDSNLEHKRQYWVSPSSGRLRKFQNWIRVRGTNQQWQLTNENEIEINQTPSEDIFKTEVPEGYSAKNTKESAIIRKLQSQIFWVLTTDNQMKTLGEINIIVALPDGTLIMSWNSRQDSMVELLKQFNIGNELPEIPLELNYSLEFLQNSEDISFSAQHFTETQKDGVFYEWYIYVPDKDMSDINLDRLQGYRLFAASYTNAGAGPYMRFPYSRRFSPDLIIQGEEDFGTFALGAMAELSDDGEAPEGITYEKVSRLAQEIRKSSAK